MPVSQSRFGRAPPRCAAIDAADNGATADADATATGEMAGMVGRGAVTQCVWSTRRPAHAAVRAGEARAHQMCSSKGGGADAGEIVSELEFFSSVARVEVCVCVCVCVEANV